MQNEIASLKTECSNLQSKLHNEQTLYKDVETEYLEFIEMTFRSIDKEAEHYKHVTQRHSKEVSELKTEIKHLKSKLATAESNATTGATNISTTKQISAHQERGKQRENDIWGKQPAKTNIPWQLFCPRLSKMRQHSTSSAKSMSSEEFCV